MNVTYLALNDAEDIYQWSGLDFYIAKAIEKPNVNLTRISCLAEFKVNSFLPKKYFYKLFRKKFPLNRMPEFAKGVAYNALSALKERPETDVLFSPTSMTFCYLLTDKIKVFYTDATFHNMINFYEVFKNLSKESIRNGHMLEKSALDNCDIAIYSSNWAADSAINFYGADPNKIKVVPFGANIDIDLSPKNIQTVIDSKEQDICDLLFIGVDWERKGGPIALKVAEILNKRGLQTRLHVVGIKEIPVDDLPIFVTNHGFMSKRNDNDMKTMEKLFKKCAFLILPSKADCTPIVFSEASSFGLPVITTNIGGIPSIIKNAENGMMFDSSDDADSYADYIYNTFQNKNLYNNLCFSSYNRFKKVLNWEVAGNNIINYIKEIK